MIPRFVLIDPDFSGNRGWFVPGSLANPDPALLRVFQVESGEALITVGRILVAARSASNDDP